MSWSELEAITSKQPIRGNYYMHYIFLHVSYEVIHFEAEVAQFLLYKMNGLTYTT